MLCWPQASDAPENCCAMLKGAPESRKCIVQSISAQQAMGKRICKSLMILSWFLVVLTRFIVAAGWQSKWIFKSLMILSWFLVVLTWFIVAAGWHSNQTDLHLWWDHIGHDDHPHFGSQRLLRESMCVALPGFFGNKWRSVYSAYKVES